MQFKLYYQLLLKSWLAKSSCFLLPFSMPLVFSSWHFPHAPSLHELKVLANKLGTPRTTGQADQHKGGSENGSSFLSKSHCQHEFG